MSREVIYSIFFKLQLIYLRIVCIFPFYTEYQHNNLSLLNKSWDLHFNIYLHRSDCNPQSLIHCLWRQRIDQLLLNLRHKSALQKSNQLTVRKCVL